MKKRTPVSAYRLFASPSNKQIVFVSFYKTPCSLIYEKKADYFQPNGRRQKKPGKLVTSAKKEEGGSGQNHDLRFL